MVEGADKVSWYVIADCHVDRDLQLGSLRVLIDRDRSRAVAAFAKEPHAFRRILRDEVRKFNTYVTSEGLDNHLEALSDLLDAGILSSPRADRRARSCAHSRYSWAPSRC
jgi:hypothetical protein